MSSDVMTTDLINLHGSAGSRSDAITEAWNLLERAGKVTGDYLDAMFAREKTLTTYMGNMLAIPHGEHASEDQILESGICLVRYDDPIEWDGPDHPVRFVVGIAGKDGGHIELLSQVALVFNDPDSISKLEAATQPSEVVTIIKSVQAQ